MADNFLEKRLEQYKAKAKGASSVAKHNNGVLSVIKKNSAASIDTSFAVRDDQLKTIASVIEALPQCKEQFAYHTGVFYCNTLSAGCIKGVPLKAHIVISLKGDCVGDNMFALGMLAQTMLIRAAEIGLKGVVYDISAEDKNTLSSIVGAPVLLVLAFGRAVCSYDK